MNISSTLGLHGWLHIIMFAVIAILIKRCAEMQQFPVTQGDEEEMLLLRSHADTARPSADTPVASMESSAAAYSTLDDWSSGGFANLQTGSSVYTPSTEHTGSSSSSGIYGGESSKSLAQMDGTRSLQGDWDRSTYCATEARDSSSQPLYSESHLDFSDDITMLTSEATAMSEDSGNDLDLEIESDLGGLDLLSKASTFIIDSTVGTFMQMTQAYMQDDYSTPQKEEPPDNHVIDKEGSSVWCWGSHHSQRLCRFRNLCYLPEHDDFVFFHSPNSVISGLPGDRFSPTLLDISSVHDHNGQYFNYVDLPASQAAGLNIEMIHKKSLIYRRFNPDNLMHVIHDDLLPMYFTLHMISQNGTRGESLPFDVNLVFIENWTPGDHVNLYQVFSSVRPIFKTDLESKTKLTCFADAYVGVTKSTTWYQYGFREPQGPIPGYSVTAHEIRMFTNYLKDRLETHSITVPNGQDYVVLFTRKHNRLILNEVELTLALVTQLRVKVITLGIETHSIAEMVAILSKATVLIGMHGSLLSLAMFLRPGAILVELFPYAVNPEHYTPYKTLMKLPGMNIMYKSWRNMDSTKTIGHPDRGWDTGGINHLPKDEQDRILQSGEVPRHLCCRDAEWLYRIYQDTIVDTDALVKLVAGAMEEQSQNLQNSPKLTPIARQHRLHPGSVLDIKCTDPKDQVPSSLQSMTPPSLNLSWQPPWNAQYLNPQSVKYEVWIQEQNQDQYTAWILSRTSYSFSSGLKPQTNYSVWVRCILNDMVHGQFNKDHVSCST